ncbi:MAG: hypothetical protein JJD92_02605 [Frankiaceae bacterium]|nr:hypothetical protein [Frankiaceae bacterium]
MRTIHSTSGTTSRIRRAPVVSTLAAICLSVPLVIGFGTPAFAADDAAAVAERGNSAQAQAAAALKKDDTADNANGLAKGHDAAVIAAKPAGFIGPVAPASTTGTNTNTTSVPFTNQGGVTTGSNTTSYEVVNGRSGSPAVGGGQPSGDVTQLQPFSTADGNNTGANDTSASNPYRSTRDGAPSLNGNGGGKQVGQPCAGCVGKADNKNPPGQAPNATDGNAGYECDRNHGIGRSNPAHTACTTPPSTPNYDCKGHLLPNNHSASECETTNPSYDCKGHLLPNNHDATECGGTNPSYDCKGHLLPNNHDATECGGTNPSYDCKGHLLPNNHDASECGGGGGGGGELCPNGNPMPASGNVADCNPPKVCPPAGSSSPAMAGCPITGGDGGPATTPGTVTGRTNTPATVVTPVGGTTPGPGTALPFTGSSTEMLTQAALLLLLVGTGLMYATRKPKPALALV